MTTAKIADSNVTTAKIANSNVTTAKIADSAVTSAKIADGTIVNGDISSSAAIAYSKLSGVAPTSHNHSTWTLSQSYDNTVSNLGWKRISVYLNSNLKLCYYYFNIQLDNNITANTVINVSNDTWLNYVPLVPATGTTNRFSQLYTNGIYEVNCKVEEAVAKNSTIFGSLLFPYKDR